MSDYTILEALNSLDVSNKEHWTSDGLPRLDVLSALIGLKDLKREAVTLVAPKFTRDCPFTAEEEVLTTFGLTESDMFSSLQEALQEAELKVSLAEKALNDAQEQRNKAAAERDKIIEEQEKNKHPNQNQIDIMEFLEGQKKLRMERAAMISSNVSIAAPIDQDLARRTTSDKKRSVITLRRK